MRHFQCPRCGAAAMQEYVQCDACGLEIGLHPPTLTMQPAPTQGTQVGDAWWYPCGNRSWRCNWLVAADSGSGTCVSCRLTRTRPDAQDTLALETLATTASDKRRLLIQLAELGLPVRPWFDGPGGLGFDLLSSRTNGDRVVIGHANGIVTIDLAESLDAHRESLRVNLGEPYRTMLGHFRHEVGHYYEWVLVEQTGWIDECREIFGDERASHADAISRHYREGAPPDWTQRYISEYATMHPWEDFAECWAHYLHIHDTLTVTATGGLELSGAAVQVRAGHVVRPRTDYTGATMAQILEDWIPVSSFFNRVNRAMGKRDLYPFGIVDEVARKLDFVHRVVVASRVEVPLPS